ncbi:MAG: S-adenosyl-l-methionine hydroxide adenosyltransferase family protein [Ktedonobacterales bacterium]
MPVPAPAIALLTDFGTADAYPGVMCGIMLGIAPTVPTVTLTHEIPPQDVVSAAWVLHTAWRSFPAGSVFLCVVDPGVGGTRRPIALAAGGCFFVGPDNGLFSFVLAGAAARAAVVLDNPRYRLPHVSATFHGRDVFAPAAAHLAVGVPLATLGTPLAPHSLLRLPLSAPQWEDDTLVGHVVHVDHFGNLITDIAGSLAAALLNTPCVTLRLDDTPIAARAETFAAAPTGTPVALLDSSGHLAVALRDGSAAAALSAGRGASLRAHGVPRA